MRWIIASATTTSVPGRTARCWSTQVGPSMSRGSIRITRAPAARACLRNGSRWMLLCLGLAPHSRMQRATAKSGKKRKNSWSGLSAEARLARVNAIRKGRGLPPKSA